MILWPFEDFVRPIRTYFARKNRTRWRQRRNKGNCPLCKLPYDTGTKRCVVDSCGHHRCYACLYAQDACPICLVENATPNRHDKFKFIKSRNNKENENQTSFENIRKRLKVDDNRRTLNEIEYARRNVKRVSQISNISTEFSFEAALSNKSINDVALKPLYFEVPQTEEEYFLLYRDWVFQEIYEAILSSNFNGVVLEGDEGSGKTSLILQLVEWSTFGCKRKSVILNDVPLISWDTLMKLSSFVVGYHFCIDDCRETCLVPDFIHSLAAQLCQAPQLEKYRQLIIHQESYQEFLSLDFCIENPDAAFTKGILEPLSTIESFANFPSLILIDNIHESSSRSIHSFLATYINQFPSWLKVVMTVNTTKSQLTDKLPLRRIILNNGELKVKEDLLRYIHCRIKKSPVIEKNVSLHGSGNQFSRFAEYIISRERSSFLYVKLILDLIAKNHIVVKSTTFNVIPVSLEEVLMLTFNLRFPSTVTFSKVKIILEVCLAALSPMSAVDIFYCTESAKIQPDTSWLSFVEVLNSLSGILVQRRDQSLMLANASLRRWLLTNNKFVCDVKSGHTYHALFTSRLHYALPPAKELELIYHITRCNLFENEESLRLLWIYSSCIKPSAVIVNPRLMFSPDNQIIRFLLQTGADSNSVMSTYHKYPILSCICKLGIFEIVSTLINFKADPNLSNSMGITALMEAAIEGHLEIIEMLIPAGAKIHLRDKAGRCALSWAATKGNLKVVDTLLKKKNNWPTQVSFSQAVLRALISAAGENNLEICKILLEVDTLNKVIIEQMSRDYLSRTLISQMILKKCLTSEHLPMVSANGHLQSLHILYNKGVVLDTKDLNGRTALSWACESGKTDLVCFLIEKGADFTVKDNESSNLLHIASSHGHEKILKMLLELKMDPDTKNAENNTPLECAIVTRSIAAVNALLEAGVNIGSNAFELSQGNVKIYILLLNKLLSDGVSLYKRGNVIEANHHFEYAWSKTRPESNFEQIRARLQESLYLCKCKIKEKNIWCDVD
ncbi:hypothetical protein JTE90_011015 [Oedothorax gibbosus]|uniref:RING-type domain-containing protein n=1 Tax=Oedothorax gibbosus TaxID=931172 RepID=A0AAV6VFL0_9ARAC|nr:hypothetical protein JTE90_011015 [Oedothorax gibbosus]